MIILVHSAIVGAKAVEKAPFWETIASRAGIIAFLTFLNNYMR